MYLLRKQPKSGRDVLMFNATSGYQIVGRTAGGRRLKLIVKEKSRGVIRVITGWDV